MRTPRLRLLSAILAVALFFTLLPVSALAEDSGSNANTGLTIGIVGNLNHWDESHSISMKEVSPAVYEVTIMKSLLRIKAMGLSMAPSVLNL